MSRAAVAAVSFALIGIADLLFEAPHTVYVLPHSIFFFTLVLNTFFSVRFFSRVIPESNHQFVIDTLITIAYAGLAVSIGYEIPFAFFALVVFILAPLKYVFLRRLGIFAALLKRKITINLLGAALCMAVFTGTALGFALPFAWTLAVVFVIANIYLLFVRPMYRV